MFEILADLFKIQSVLYMGSFVHISPALVISNCVFVDNDRRVAKFFEDEEVAEFVNKNKKYKEDASFQAFQQNYEKPLPLKNNSFDLLISQYAGIISETGKKYLKKDGILLVNSSHGDAAVAHLDEDFELIGVMNGSGESWRFSDSNLEHYFIPKSKKPHPTKEEIKKSGRGVGYTKSATNYVFKKIK